MKTLALLAVLALAACGTATTSSPVTVTIAPTPVCAVIDGVSVCATVGSP